MATRFHLYIFCLFPYFLLLISQQDIVFIIRVLFLVGTRTDLLCISLPKRKSKPPPHRTSQLQALPAVASRFPAHERTDGEKERRSIGSGQAGLHHPVHFLTPGFHIKRRGVSVLGVTGRGRGLTENRGQRIGVQLCGGLHCLRKNEEV